jgi:hypothetical protein
MWGVVRCTSKAKAVFKPLEIHSIIRRLTVREDVVWVIYSAQGLLGTPRHRRHRGEVSRDIQTAMNVDWSGLYKPSTNCDWLLKCKRNCGAYSSRMVIHGSRTTTITATVTWWSQDRPFKMSIKFYKFDKEQWPEDSTINTYQRENLKSVHVSAAGISLMLFYSSILQNLILLKILSEI